MGIFDFFRRDKEDDVAAYQRRREQEERKAAQAAQAAEKSGDWNFSGTFRMQIDDVFSITGRGTVVTGRIAQGVVRVGDIVTLETQDGNCRQVTVAGIEAFRRLLESAEAGENVGLLLSGVSRNEVRRGDWLTETALKTV